MKKVLIFLVALLIIVGCTNTNKKEKTFSLDVHSTSYFEKMENVKDIRINYMNWGDTPEWHIDVTIIDNGSTIQITEIGPTLLEAMFELIEKTKIILECTKT